MNRPLLRRSRLALPLLPLLFLRPQGGFIGNPAIMTSDKALACFSPAE